MICKNIGAVPPGAPVLMPMFQRYSPDKQFIAKIKKGSISVNTGDRVTVLAFVNHLTS